MIDSEGVVVSEKLEEMDAVSQGAEDEEWEPDTGPIIDYEGKKRKKYYIEGGIVEIAVDHVYELDPSGNVLRVVRYTDYTAKAVRELFTASQLHSKWKDRDQRASILK